MRLAPILLLLAVVSCRSPELQPRHAGSAFDTEGWFKKEALRLSAAQTSLRKTAIADGHEQTRALATPDWTQELALFAGSVINKPSWQGKYRSVRTKNQEGWFTREEHLRTRMIRIRKTASGAVRRIDIHNRMENVLYRTDEWLSWIPDSGYTIRKEQKVRFLASTRYSIRGKIN